VSAPGRLLGVDYGTVRIGLAIGDPQSRIASPLTMYQRRKIAQDKEYFQALIAQESVSEIVVGLPIHLSGREGDKAREARGFGKWLAAATGLPVILWDERFTTVEAENHLASAGLTRKKRKLRRDQVAAQILLQSYLDAGCPGEVDTRPLDEP
jgi:putative Holliday junction resolvase